MKHCLCFALPHAQTLPRACSMLGSALGFGLLWVVAAMTWVSVSRGVVHPSAELLAVPDGDDDTEHGEAPEAMQQQQHGSGPASPRPMSVSFSGLIRAYLGNHAAQVFNVFLIVNALGFSGGREAHFVASVGLRCGPTPPGYQHRYSYQYLNIALKGFNV